MMEQKVYFLKTLTKYPVIAVINDQENMNEVFTPYVKLIFILNGNIFNLKTLIPRLHKEHKMVFVHYDLMGGFAKDTTGLDFLISHYKPDGIISTKSHLIKFSRNKGILTIQRLFLLDSINLESGINSIHEPDAIEILPGIMPRITRYVVNRTGKPIITGGLIECTNDIKESLTAGAIGISTSNKQLWKVGNKINL